MKAFIFYKDLIHFPMGSSNQVVIDQKEIGGRFYNPYIPEMVIHDVEKRHRGRKDCAAWLFNMLNDAAAFESWEFEWILGALDITPPIIFKRRSMSAGDLIIYEDGDVFSCDPHGWGHHEDLKNWGRIHTADKDFDKMKKCILCPVQSSFVAARFPTEVVRAPDKIPPPAVLCTVCHRVVTTPRPPF